MAKYSDEYKLTVVEQYLGGTDGLKTVGDQYGVKKGLLQEWIASYRVHGAVGLRKKYSHYSAEFKLSVLKHMWDNKLSCRETAAFFNLRGSSCLTTWERCYHSGGIEALEPRQRGRLRTMPDTGSKSPPSPDEDKRSREDLLAELNHLRMENAYLKKVEALVRSKQAQKKRK